MAKEKSTISRLFSIFGTSQDDWNALVDPDDTQRRILRGQSDGSFTLQKLDNVATLEAYQNYLFRRKLSRKEKFTDFDLMDYESGDIGIALDMYSEEATQVSFETGKVFWVSCEDEAIAEDLNKMLDKIELDERGFTLGRATAKYGETFTYVHGQIGKGVQKITMLHPSLIEPNIVNGKINSWRSPEVADVFPEAEGGVFPVYKIIQFLIPDYSATGVVSRSMLENSVKIWRILDMMEVMAQIYRLNRSIERRIFKIDVGKADVYESLKLVQMYQNFVKGRSLFDPNTGEYKVVKDPNNILEDVFWPTRPDSNSDVDIMVAPGNIGEVLDLQYFRGKLRVSLGIPSDYFEEEGSGGFDKGMYLALQDIRFARRIHRLQLALKKGIKKLCKIHLVLKGAKGPIPKFDIHMTDISQIATQKQMETLRDAVDNVTSLVDFADVMGWNKKEWGEWLAEKFLKVPQEVISRLSNDEEVPPADDIFSSLHARSLSEKQLIELRRVLKKLKIDLGDSITRDLSD